MRTVVAEVPKKEPEFNLATFEIDEQSTEAEFTDADGDTMVMHYDRNEDMLIFSMPYWTDKSDPEENKYWVSVIIEHEIFNHAMEKLRKLAKEKAKAKVT